MCDCLGHDLWNTLVVVNFREIKCYMAKGKLMMILIIIWVVDQ